MPNKYEEYYELAQRTEEDLTKSRTIRKIHILLKSASKMKKVRISNQFCVISGTFEIPTIIVM